MKAILYAGVFAVLVVFIQGRVKFSLMLHHYEVYNILLEFLDYAFDISYSYHKLQNQVLC